MYLKNIKYIIMLCLCLLLIFLYIKPRLNSIEKFEEILITPTITPNSVTNVAEQYIASYLASLPTDKLFPSGIISIWSGTIQTIPTGWVLCDGTNNTPDLRGRFVLSYNAANITVLDILTQNRDNSLLPDIGNTQDILRTAYSANAISNTGGTEVETINSTQLPGHAHSLMYYFDLITECSSGIPDSPCGTNTTLSTNYPTDYSRPLNNTNTQCGDMSKPPDGNGNYPAAPHNNMPPYYVLAFIMKI